MTAQDLKKVLANQMFWRLHYSVVVDEFDFMDMFGVRRNGYSAEFEIKISKSDFMREINSINAKQPLSRWGKNWAKWEKHAHYLGRRIEHIPTYLDAIPGYAEQAPKFFIPNEYSFYVPEELTQFALTKLTNLPYGLIQYGRASHNGGISYFHSDYEVIKKPTKLHGDKRCGEIMEKLAHALTIRSRLFA